MTRYREGLESMPTYEVEDRDWLIKLDANESTLNLPPLVEDRLLARLSRLALHRYPSAEAMTLLRESIAHAFQMQAENVLLGNGSSEIIEKLFYAFGGHGKKILYPTPSFSMYPIYARAADAEGIAFPLGENWSLDVSAFIQRAEQEQVSLAVLCNPNNPTGNVWPREVIAELAEKLPCPLLVDEAYIDFCPEHAATDLLPTHKNLLLTRTFSKAYGLAGARVGFLLADAGMVQMVAKAYMPYYLNALSLATADIVFQMRDEFQPRIAMTIAERKRMQKALQSIQGLQVFPSATNFICIQTTRAQELWETLAAQGIGVRKFGAGVLQNCLRISMGTRQENDVWLATAQDFFRYKNG